MKILCDDREDGAVLKMVVESGLDAKVCRLKACDYVCEETSVCIERKTIDDFCASIVDGRMKSQVERIKKVYNHCYIIISGRIADRKADIKENCILGMISSIAYSGVNIITVDDDKQLVFLMKRLFERHSEVKKNGK